MKKSDIIKRTVCSFFIAGILLSGHLVYKDIPLDNSVVYAATAFDGFEYQELDTDDEVMIIKCTKTKDTVIEVPEFLGERKVVSIGENAFIDCKSVITIKLPKTISTIAEGSLACPNLNEILVADGNNTFRSTEDGVLIDKTSQSPTLVQFPAGKVDDEGKPLTEYTIPDDIGIIAQAAFKNAKNLQKVNFGNNVTTISAEAFYGCVALTEAVLPESIKTISDYAFYNCAKLTKVNLGRMEAIVTEPEPESTDDPDSTSEPLPAPTPTVTYNLHSNLTTIGAGAFQECVSLASVRIPSTCTSIGSKAFYNCKGMAELLFDKPTVNLPELKIGDQAFAECTNSKLVSITLPSSVKIISYRMFYHSGGKGLVINLPDNVEEIDEEAFASSSLTQIVIPKYVDVLGKAAFKNCTALTMVEQYFIKDDNDPDIKIGMTKISEEAFYGCKALNSLTIPVNVKEIGARAFYGTSLTKVDLPLNITSIEDETFYGCQKLLEITIPSKVSYIGERAFYGCTLLKTVNVEGRLTEIGEEAFYNCKAMEEFNIKEEYKDSLEEMGKRTFYGCTSLKRVVFSKNMTEIPDEMFRGCVKLESVDIPNTIRRVGVAAFYGCTGLQSLKFNNINLNYEDKYPLVLEDKCFYGCTSLQNITFSNNIESIPDSCFYQSGVKTLTIPKNIKTVGKSAFMNSASMTSLTLEYDEDGGESGVESIGESAFSGCKALATVSFSKKMTDIPASAFALCGIKELVIPSNIKTIGDYAFNKCTNLTSVVCSDGVEKIGAHCFEGDTALKDVDLGNTVSSMGEYAFNGASALETFTFSPLIKEILPYTFNKSFNGSSTGTLTIPSTVETIRTNAFLASNVPNVVIEDGVKSIETLAFSGCKYLKTVKLPKTISIIPDSTFSGCSALTEIVIPGNVKQVGNSAFSSCGITSAVLEEGVETIGTSSFASCKNLKTVSIPTTLTAIPANAFASCGITELTIPGNVKTIGSQAFSNCSALTNLVLKDGIESIGTAAFEKTKLLATVTLPKTISEIPENTFNGSGLTELTVPGNVKKIGKSAFASNTSLKKATLENGVENISESAFASCKALESIELPESLKTLEAKAFNQNTSLKSITVPGGVTEIGESAFASDTALTNVVMNTGTEKIGTSAFSGCKVLTSVTYPSTLKEIGEKAFNGCVKLYDPAFPIGLEKIGASAFSGCTEFVRLLLPEKLTYLGNSAFAKCTNLESATFSGNAPSTFDKSVFTGAHTGFRIYHYVGTSGFTSPRWYEYVCEEISITEIIMVSYPTKTRYIQGECTELDRTGMKVIVKYSNKDELDVTHAVTITGFMGNPATLGDQTIEISYPNAPKTFTFTITVVEKTPIDIQIDSLPNKTEYLRGSELDLSGMVVSVLYDNGKTEPIPLSDCKISGYYKDQPGSQTVTLTYSIVRQNGSQFSRMVKFDVTVIDRTLIGITVETTKLEYSQNSKFDPDSTTVIAIYDNNETVVLKRDDYDVINFDTTAIGPTSFVIEYGGSTFKVDIVVVETLPIKLNISNNRTQYIAGEEFKEGDAIVSVEYDNGLTEEIPFGQYEVNLNLTTPPYNCTISYKGLTNTYSVEIVDKVLSEIQITLPNKLVYAIGENFDPTGLTVTAIYTNGSTEPITDPSKYTVSGFDSKTAGVIQVTVIYQNKFKNFDITVTGNTLSDLDVVYTKIYPVGASLDKSTMEVYAVYSDNSRTRIYNFDVEGFNSYVVGSSFFTVSYSGITKKLPVTIVSNDTVASLTGIRVDRLTNNPYIVGETYFDRSSIRVVALYNNGTETVLKSDEYDVRGMDTSSEGTVIVTISYLGHEYPVAIQVVAKTLINIKLVKAPTKTLYSVGEAIDTTGMEVIATYDDGSTADVTSNCEILGDTFTAGTKVIRVKYMNVTQTFTITVTDTVTITGITVTGYTRTYLQGSPFDNKLTVYASFDDGSVSQIASGYEVEGFNSSKTGINRVTVKYMGKTASFDVIIIPVEDIADIMGINVTVVGPTEYIIGAPNFDRSSIVVTVIKSDGTEELLDNYSVSGFETATPGIKNLTISYLAFSKDIQINVTNKEVTGIIVTPPTKLTYTQGEKIDTAGMTVMVLYSDGSSANVTGQVILGGYDPEKVGVQTITVVYGTKTSSFNITVEPSLSSLCSVTVTDARISRNNKVTANISTVNTTDNIIMGVMACAIYEKNDDGTRGKMIGIHTEDTIIMQGNAELSVSFTAGDTDADEFIVTAFVWQDLNSMLPITEKTSFDI
ncbi:MAG: leucine-rich repeat protein [Oscillospiraceae bacterium]|nr:leucine-rich repeat protein [Oscillospiraceae bacterium]